MITIDHLLLVGVIFLAAIIGSNFVRGVTDQQTRLLFMDRKINLILNHFNIDDNNLTNTVQDLIRQGRKIEAIKLYREESGLGLKAAKDAVEQIELGSTTGSQ